jgi:hypothetical protein
MARKSSERISDVLAAAGPQSPVISRVLAEVAEHLLEQSMVLTSSEWSHGSVQDDVVFAALSAALGTQGRWDSELILGRHAIQYLREINQQFHSTDRTQGAAKHKHHIIRLQGGDYCAVCGARGATVVDHVLPVRRGGSPDELANLQLLCVACNSAKSCYGDSLLPEVLTTHTGSLVAPQLRYKVLIQNTTELEGRMYGLCLCGRTAQQSELTVIPKHRALACNFLTVQVVCDACTSIRDTND